MYSIDPSQLCKGKIGNVEKNSIAIFAIESLKSPFSSTAADRKALQRVIITAQQLIGCPLPSLEDIYASGKPTASSEPVGTVALREEFLGKQS